MSAAVKWRPADRGWKTVNSWAPSALKECMDIAGSDATYSEGDIPFLRGVASALRKTDGKNYCCVMEIIQAIEAHGKVEVRWSY